VPNVPPVAATATYTYDSLNRPTAITDSGSATFGYGYDAVDRLVSRTLPNDVVSTYQFDGLDRLTGLTDVKGQGTIASAQYQYDASGNITQKTDGSGTHGYSYDSIRRLTSATHPGGSNESYAYDAVGNRTSSHRSTSYGYQPFNRLQTTSAATFNYDNNGNLLSKAESAGTTTFTWDYENRLTGVTPPTGPSVSYKYDALGRRVERRTGTLDYTQFTYDGQDVVLDRNGDGSTVSYLNGPGLDNKLRQSGLSGTFYYLSDHLRSTTALTDVLGNVVEQNSYDSFGDGAGSTRTRYGYTGRERDQTTGLYYYRARWYDSQEGRFISEDPIGFSAGVNFYAYVGGNPLTRRDPSGLDWLENLSDFSAGFGDTISFGWTATFRQYWNYDDVVNRCSGWYKAGEWTGTAHQLVSAGAGIAKVTGGILARRAASRAAREAAEEIAEEVVESNLDDGVRIIKEYMGDGAKANKSPGGSDLIIRSADRTKQIRFDLTNPHGMKPHINFEVWRPRGLYPGDRKMIEVLNLHIFPKP
jgi:RHS repeat-associated protein